MQVVYTYRPGTLVLPPQNNADKNSVPSKPAQGIDWANHKGLFKAFSDIADITPPISKVGENKVQQPPLNDVTNTARHTTRRALQTKNIPLPAIEKQANIHQQPLSLKTDSNYANVSRTSCGTGDVLNKAKQTTRRALQEKNDANVSQTCSGVNGNQNTPVNWNYNQKLFMVFDAVFDEVCNMK